MTSTDSTKSDTAKWDPHFTERVYGAIRVLIKGYHRSEVRGLESFPPGGALVVANHSGGVLAMDIPVFATGFYDMFGYDRPVLTLSHDILLNSPISDVLVRLGLIRATRDNAAAALRAGAVVMVFPGGDYDTSRPTAFANTIDFAGRTGYVKTALEAGVPIIPTVLIGGQENQLYLSRGEWLARNLGLKRLLRIKFMPITVGFPFGLNVLLPLNVPLPTKIVAWVLEPIDLTARFGDNPDVDEVDAHVRHVMQVALSKLAEERRFPVLG